MDTYTYIGTCTRCKTNAGNYFTALQFFPFFFVYVVVSCSLHSSLGFVADSGSGSWSWSDLLFFSTIPSRSRTHLSIIYQLLTFQPFLSIFSVWKPEGRKCCMLNGETMWYNSSSSMEKSGKQDKRLFPSALINY